MPRIVVAFLSFLFLIPQGLLATPRLAQISMSKVAPGADACSVPTATTSFSTTDSAAWVYFTVTGVNLNDRVEADFFSPSGSLYTYAAWDPETDPGDLCYVASISIAGKSAATLPGTWKVYIGDNGVVLGQPFSFTITTATTCTYSLSSSSDPNVPAAGGSGSFTVTMTAGCTASVSSDPWITLSASGTTVNYTVAAKTSTSSRVGHITVSGAGGVG